MRKSAAWVVLASAVVITLLPFLLPRGSSPPLMLVDAGTVALFHDANTVVVRYVYPYSSPPSAVAAGTAAVMVLVGLGKVPVVQSIDRERGVCYTNEGNAEVVVEKSVKECLDLPYPAIVIIEDREMSITMHGSVVEVRGPPERLKALTLYALSEMFPGVSRLYAQAVEKASEINIPIPERRRR